jgi:citrate lyase subunit beta / citryl-CoA lyase
MLTNPRRSALYLPASNLRAIDKARTLPCDVVILDLEDAVAPEAKLLARQQAIAAVRGGGFAAREVVVRINGLDTEWAAEDIEAIARVAPDALLLPKVNEAADIVALESLLGPSCTVSLWAMIETAKSIVHVNEIAAASARTRLTCLVMGTNDLAMELGAHLNPSREPVLGILGLSVVAARAHELAILDGVFNSLDDEAGFDAQCRQGAAFGFDGKTLIHPRQISACNAAFTPDAAAVTWAERILSCFQEPENAGKGAIKVDGRMVERLHLSQARRILAAARRSDIAASSVLGRLES